MSGSRVALVAAVVVLASVAPGQEERWEGRHRVALDCPGGELPFFLIVTRGESGWTAQIENGPETIPVVVPEVTAKTLRVRFPHYGSELTFQVTAAGLPTGTWVKSRGGSDPVRLVARFTSGSHRFPEYGPPATLGGPMGRYAVRFARESDPAVGVFERGPSGLWATFLTSLGDYRWLAGAGSEGAFSLSCFDGAHAFLFRGRQGPDGSLSGDFWSSDTWHDTWTGVPDPEAQIPDPWTATRAREGLDLSKLKFRDEALGWRSLDDPEFRGQVRVVKIFGTWCPNCQDLGAYLSEVEGRYRDRGLKIIGLACEYGDETEQQWERVRAFSKRHNTAFPVFLASTADKGQATSDVGLVDRVRAFPTTVFVGRDGHIAAVYQGFAGPATGVEHQRLRQRFEDVIEGLLVAPR